MRASGAGHGGGPASSPPGPAIGEGAVSAADRCAAAAAAARSHHHDRVGGRRGRGSSPGRSWPCSARRGSGLRRPAPGCCASWRGSTRWLTDVANAIKVAGTGWGVTVVSASVIVRTMVFRRWRHLLVLMGSVFSWELPGPDLRRAVQPAPARRRADHRQLGRVCGGVVRWAWLTIFLMGAVYCLVVPAWPRLYAKIASCRGRRGVLSRAHVPGGRLSRRCAAQRGAAVAIAITAFVSSPRTRCSPSSTGAAASPTST